MRSVTVLSSVCLVVGLAMVASCGADSARSEGLAEAEAEPAIASVQTRDVVLRIHVGERFSLVSASGEVLARGITLDELWAIAPALADHYERGVAGGLDATLYDDDIAGESGPNIVP